MIIRPKYQMILRPRYQQISKDIKTKASTNIQWFWDQGINKYQMVFRPSYQQISKDLYTKKSTNIQWYWDQKSTTVKWYWDHNINKYQMFKTNYRQIIHYSDRFYTNKWHKNFTSVDDKNKHTQNWMSFCYW